MIRRVVAFIVLALAAVPLAAASAGWRGEISTTSLQAEEANASGALLALILHDAPSNPALPRSEFTFEAASARVETLQADPVAVMPLRGSGVVPFPQSSVEDYGPTKATGLAIRETYSLELFPQAGLPFPTLDATEGCLGMSPPTQDIAESQPMVDATRKSQVNVAEATSLHPCSGDAAFRIVGSFCLGLWEWDVLLQTDAGTVELKSGYDRSDTDPEGLLFPSVVKARQQFLCVTEGILTLPMDTSPHYVYVQDPKLSAKGAVTFADALGKVSRAEETVDVHARSFAVDGRFTLNTLAQGKDRPLRVLLEGDLAQVQSDGQPVALASVAAAPADAAGRAWWPWALGAAGLAGAVLLAPKAVRVHRSSLRRINRISVLAENSLALLDHDRALAMTRRLLEAEPNVAEWHFLHAKALLGLGQPREALRHHEVARDLLRGIEGLDELLVAENAFAAACALGRLTGAARGEAERQDLFDQAVAWLRNATSHWPALRREMHSHSDLQPFLAAFPAWSSGDVSDLLKP